MNFYRCASVFHGFHTSVLPSDLWGSLVRSGDPQGAWGPVDGSEQAWAAPEEFEKV